MGRAGLTWDGDPRVKPPFGAARINRGHLLARDLVGFWPINEHGGNLLTDLASSKQGTLAALGAAAKPTWRPNRLDLTSGNASGADASYVTVPDHPVFDIVDAVSLMVSFSQDLNGVSDLAGVAGKWGVALSDRSYLLWFTAAGTLAFQVGDGTTTTGPTTSTLLNTTYVAVGTYDRSTIALYLDGVLKNTVAATAAMPSTTRPFEIGLIRSDDPTRFAFDGQITYVYLWRRAITASEVTTLHAEPYAFLRPKVARRYFVPTVAAGWGPLFSRQRNRLVVVP